MEKSPEAFRTISEVADLLDTPAHVLRFWESRFPQIRPVKRAGAQCAADGQHTVLDPAILAHQHRERPPLPEIDKGELRQTLFARGDQHHACRARKVGEDRRGLLDRCLDHCCTTPHA